MKFMKITVRVCLLLQNRCRYHLQSKRLCDNLFPTIGDDDSIGQMSQPIFPLIKESSALNASGIYKDGLFADIAQRQCIRIVSDRLWVRIPLSAFTTNHSRGSATRHYREISNVIKTASKVMTTNAIYNVTDGTKVDLL